jgi:hypothetical protein
MEDRGLDETICGVDGAEASMNQYFYNLIAL